MSAVKLSPQAVINFYSGENTEKVREREWIKKNIPFFKGFSLEEIKYLTENAGQKEHFQKGYEILSQGEVHDHLYAILSGEITITHNDIQNTLKKGDVFGEKAIAQENTEYSPFQAEVSKNSHLWSISKNTLNNIHLSNPTIAAKTYKKINMILAGRIQTP
ncbi:cyclic nucleotide-binding domain-containing protein [Candidatus Peregrinibacteria bacterium]|jgi:CRP-like cAMP-binding protein|nr:cyclic nucleotide-binding domain-containing protein [Candidatus Peregrinibacteria bacterium]